jgi:hypothetical protein
VPFLLGACRPSFGLFGFEPDTPLGGRYPTGVSTTRLTRITALIGRTVLFALFAVGCEPANEGPDTTRTTAPTTRALPANGPATGRAGPPLGKTQIEISGQVVTLLAANQARLLEVLETMASAAEFELLLGQLGGQESKAVSIRVENASLAETLTRMLDGIPFALDFEVDPDDASSRLRSVRVGTFPVAGLSPKKAERPGKRSGDRRERLDTRRKERRARTIEGPTAEQLAKSARLSEERAAWATTQLDNEDWEIRAEAASKVDVEDPNELERLAYLMKNDSSANVRKSALERLSDSDSPEVIDHLLEALNDPNPEVVIEAIDEIEFEGDQTAVPKLAAGCLGHPDPTVASLCAEAIEWLE